MRGNPAFFQERPAFLALFCLGETNFLKNCANLLAPERNFVHTGSFTVKDFRLYDENSSSKGRSPAAR